MKKVFRSRSLSAVMVLLFSFGNQAIAAGFDCLHAQEANEKLVCNDAELSAQDDQLNALYKAVLATSAVNKVAGITADQKAWLFQVRNACMDRTCLKTAYDRRMEALSRINDNTAFVFNASEFSNQVEGFQASLERSGSPMKLEGCQAMLRIGTSAERSYGAFCQVGGRTILMCDDTMVGKLTVSFNPPGSSLQVLADFTRNNCPPGG
ncbi:lysozyme inhibitor LprI family protein [Dyella japonica]|uniref:Lysozyme inhibitor LprI-like N-terminal domain-containing protein n=1 Tax=Dyella japonica TaxID=231455 RepID=A0ABV2JXE9_9GAMM